MTRRRRAGGRRQPRLRLAVVGDARWRPWPRRQAGLGEGEVELGERVDRRRDGVGGASDAGAEAAQDALDLALLFDLELAPGVAQLDDRQGLEEDGGAAGRHVVDDAGDLAAHVGLDRDDVTAVAQGDDRLLGDLRGRSARRGCAGAGGQAVVGDADLAAEVGAGRGWRRR